MITNLPLEIILTSQISQNSFKGGCPSFRPSLPIIMMTLSTSSSLQLRNEGSEKSSKFPKSRRTNQLEHVFDSRSSDSKSSAQSIRQNCLLKAHRGPLITEL